MDIKGVVKAFNLGKVERSEQLTGGSVNISHKVITRKEGKEHIYVVQKLGDAIPPQATQRYVDIEAHLRENEIPIPTLLKLPNGERAINNTEAHWRVFDYIENEGTPKNKKKAVVSAASMLGKFHTVMKPKAGQFHSLLDHFHDTEHYKERLSVYNTPNLDHRLKERMDFLQEKTSNPLPNYDSAPIHGDPKLANFLFTNSLATTVIDLDTIMDANPLIDIGDAMRSWCCEDGTKFNERYFDLALSAYNKTAPVAIERDDALAATIHIAGELAIRYLTDSFEETYFEWDRNKYDSSRQSNLHRSAKLVKYITSIEKARR